MVRRTKRPLFTGSVAKELFAVALHEGLEKGDVPVIYEAPEPDRAG